MSNLDLFPETQGDNSGALTQWVGELRDDWGHPITVLRLIPSWHYREGWRCGWFIQVATAMDEWHPNYPDAYKMHETFPWYRLNSMPQSGTLAIAAAEATRAAKIVIEQMLPYATGQAHIAEVHATQEAAEARARHWLCEDA